MSVLEEFAVNALKDDIAVAIYDWHSEAERAVVALQRAGCNMKRISVVGRVNADQERVLGFLNVRDRARICGNLGSFWGGLAEMLPDSAAVFVPLRGYVFVLGNIATAKLSSLQSALVLGDSSALTGAICAIGIPRRSVPRYEIALNAHEFILLAHGDEQDAYRVRELLETSGPVSFDHLRARSNVLCSISLQEQLS